MDFGSRLVSFISGEKGKGRVKRREEAFYLEELDQDFPFCLSVGGKMNVFAATCVRTLH